MVIGMDPTGWGYGVSRVGVVLTNLAPVRLRKRVTMFAVGSKKQ
jgi:hypothetical protein